MTKHRDPQPIQWRLMYAYMLIICSTYIYNHHMVCAFGNFIDNIGEWDILGDSKCLIQYDKCDRQVLDGWSMVRFFVFMFIGYSNPHAHAPIFTLSTFVELYSYSSKCSSKFILNPIVNMSGYTIGSALCQGDCMS